MMFNGYNEDLLKAIKGWLQEDVGSGDITTRTTIPAGHESKGIIHAKEDGIICGIPVAELVFEVVDPGLVFTAMVQEGQAVSKGTVIAEVEGSTHAILTGERLALNLMQRLSGVASRTASFVEKLQGCRPAWWIPARPRRATGCWRNMQSA